MKLSEITYAILELIRGGLFIDDDKFDFRLIAAFVHSKRAEYVQQLSDSGKPIPEHFYQYIEANDKVLVHRASNSDETYKLVNVPKIVFGRHGAIISEIVESSPSMYGLAINSLPYKVMTPHAFKYAGNGRFNGNMIFSTYTGDSILLKSKYNIVSRLNDFLIKAVLQNPLEHSEFDEDIDDYPVTTQAFEYIKNAVIGIDAKIFVAGRGDKINDSIGEEQ